MGPRNVSNQRWGKLFVGIGILVLAQLTWWTTVFLRDVTLVAELKTQNTKLHANLTADERVSLQNEIESEAFHRRIMFVSESLFFGCLTLAGFILLFRALRREERAREIERNFIEIVTHESKTPLTALKLRLESVREKWGKDADLSRLLGLALEEVRRLSSIFEKVLNLNRMERQVFRFEAISVEEVVQLVVRRMEAVLRDRSVKLSLDLDPSVLVKADMDGLMNVVQNLLENAILYNDKDEKKISVVARQVGRTIMLWITDNGPGIVGEDRKRVFERFYRGKHDGRVPGTGLGLYLTKIILEAHHGDIRLLEAVEGGARFEVQLPASGGVS